MSYAFRPRARVEVDGQSLSAAEAGLHEVSVTLGLSTHGYARLVLWSRSKLAGSEPGQSLVVSLGEEETLVLTGTVCSVSRRPDCVLIEGLDGTEPLSRKRLSGTFRDSTIADIVSQLASDAEIDTDVVDADLQLEHYALDYRRSLWSHLLDLAWLSGADLCASAEGALRFAPGEDTVVATLRRGAELIDWQAGSALARTAPAFAPHGAASSGGADAWHHALSDPLGEKPVFSRVPGAARSQETADKAAEAAALRASRATTPARALALGNPEIRPGQVVSLEGLGAAAAPLAALGGGGGTSYRAVGVSHRVDSRRGFRTALRLEGTGDAGGLGGLL